MRLKALWSVYAGVIPDIPMPEHTRTWNYTSADYEADCVLPEEQTPKFIQLRSEAQEYADSLSDPRRLNWVRLEWTWI